MLQKKEQKHDLGTSMSEFKVLQLLFLNLYFNITSDTIVILPIVKMTENKKNEYIPTLWQILH
jgi:hypothetical protein